MVWASAASAVILCVAAAPISGAWAQVYVPSHEYGGYVDANGVYTIIGNVKNELPTAISAEMTVSAYDGTAWHNHTILEHFVPARSELPFSAKMPQIAPPPEGVALPEPLISYHNASGAAPTVSVMYDETLTLHPNGTLTGYVINDGDSTVRDAVMWAVVHGEGGVVDVSRSLHGIGPLEPGQVGRFTMHPDPAVAEMAVYYSCFAPSDRSVYPVTVDRSGTDYNLRYESGAWFYRPQFVENDTAIIIQTTNSYPFETFANLELPPVTREEVFTVYRNEEPIDFIQSVDEMGMWHVAFDVRKHSQDVITIRGFVPGKVAEPLVPQYFRDDALRWVAGLDDAILGDLLLLSDIKMIPAGSPGEPHMPRWLAPLLEWYGTGQITNDAFLGAISYMIERGIVTVLPE